MRRKECQTKWPTAVENALVSGIAPFHLQFAAKENAIQFLYQLDELFWVLLTAGGLRKYAPIIDLGLHT
jgi:hypothetical protein